MTSHFSAMEQSIIRTNMLNKSHRQIAELLDSTTDRIASFVCADVRGTEIITKQMALDERARATGALRKRQLQKDEQFKKQRKEEAFKKNQEIGAQQKYKRRPPMYKTIERDFSNMIMVRIDRQTFIYVKQGDDIEVARSRYLKQVEKSKAAYVAQQFSPNQHGKDTKKCRQCGIVKQRSAFRSDAKEADGKRPNCSECIDAAGKLKASERIGSMPI